MAYLELFHKYSRNFNAVQLRVFKVLYDWRDRVARLEDESVRYVPTCTTAYVAYLVSITNRTPVTGCV